MKDKYEVRAEELHRNCPAVDAHLDLAGEIEIRNRRGEREIIKNHYLKHFREAGIRIVVSSIYIESEKLPEKGMTNAMQQISALLRDMESLSGEAVLVRSRADIDYVLDNDKIGILIAMEGLDMMTEDCDTLRAFYECGVRGASLTWSRRNFLGEGCCKAGRMKNIRGGLSELGIKTVKELERLHMFVDISHLNDDGFEDVIGTIKRPLAATHSNARSIVMNYRNLTDGQIQQVAQTSGVIGMNAYRKLVGAEPGGQAAERLCRHIMHITELVGDRYIGFGLDLCDSYDRAKEGTEITRRRGDCLLNHGELMEVSAQLLREGMEESAVCGIIGGNFIRYFRSVLD